MELLLIVAAQALIGMLIGIGGEKGVLGFFLGLFLGPIGWLIILIVVITKRQKAAQENYIAQREMDSNEAARQDAQLEEIRALRKEINELRAR